jgi:hypothetical protein
MKVKSFRLGEELDGEVLPAEVPANRWKFSGAHYRRLDLVDLGGKAEYLGPSRQESSA